MSSSGFDTKSLPIYVVLMAVTGGAWILDNNSDLVTTDAIDAIREDIQRIESDLRLVNDELHSHEKIEAHPSQFVRTEVTEKTFAELKQKIYDLQNDVVELKLQLQKVS